MRIRKYRNHLSETEEIFVRENYQNKAIKQMARELSIPYSRVHESMQALKLVPPHKRTNIKRYTSNKENEVFDIDRYMREYLY